MTTSQAITRSGTVALVGRSNAGKSTLLNAALDLPLAIVSPKPQTTRDRLIGVVRHAGAEVRLLDTPGLHKATSRLGREMNRAARHGARDADVVVFMTALQGKAKLPLKPHPGDVKLIGQVGEDKPLVLVINKIDLLKDKAQLLPLIDAFAKAHTLDAVVPISAKRDDGVKRVLDEVAKLLPEGGPLLDEESITDRPMRYFVKEYVREAVLAATSKEVPHAVAVTVDEYVEPPDDVGVTRIHATIHVERSGQKGILVGKGGAMLKRIGTASRHRIEELSGRQVFLELFVRVTAGWREEEGLLSDFNLLADGDT